MYKKIFKISFLVLVVLFGLNHSVAFAADPVITSISPTTAKVGDTVTLTGTNFPTSALIHMRPDPYRLDVKPTSITSTSATFIIPFNSTDGLVSPFKITIGPDPAFNFTDGVYKYPTSNEMALSVLESTPVITSVTPASPKVGDMVTLTGTGFNYGARIVAYYQVSTLSTKSMMGVGGAIISPTSATFIMPFGIKGPTTLKFGGAGTAIFGPITTESNEVSINVIPIAPTLISITPQKVRRGMRNTIAVVGKDFDIDARLVIDNTSNVGIGGGGCYGVVGTCVSIPSESSTGMHSFTIKEMDSGLTSNALQVEFVDNPILSSVNADQWTYGTYDATGRNFADSVLHLYAGLGGVGFDNQTNAYLDRTTLLSRTVGYPFDDSFALFNLPNTLVPGSTHTIQIAEGSAGAMSTPISFTVPGKPTTASPSTPPTPVRNCQTNDCSAIPPTTPPPSNPNTSTPTCTSGQILVSNQCVSMPNTNQNTSSQSGVTGGKYNFGTVTLFKGSRGEAAKELQRFLNANLNLNLVIDGKIGPKTDAIIKQWQTNHGLKADGRVGPKTKAMMNAEAQ